MKLGNTWLDVGNLNAYAGQIAGCVRHKDIAEYLVDHFAKHVLNLPPDPEQIALTPEGG